MPDRTYQPAGGYASATQAIALLIAWQNAPLPKHRVPATYNLSTKRGHENQQVRTGSNLSDAWYNVDAEANWTMRFTITLFQDEDGMFIAECSAIPGCVSQGKTEDEAERNIHDAIKACLEVRAEKGMALTVTIRQIEVAV